MGTLWAHSANGDGVRHALVDHLQGTAALAGEFAAPFGAGELASYVGLVHDVGKATCAWQAGLDVAEQQDSRVGVPHKLAGTWLAYREVGPLAAAVFGHHGGMPCRSDLKQKLQEAREGTESSRVGEAVTRAAEVLPQIQPATAPRWPGWMDGGRWRDPEVLDVLTRLVFSALVDADFLDTERHLGGGPRPGPGLAAADLTDRFEAGRAGLLAEAAPSPIDGLREEVYAQAIEAASGPAGVYRLPAPTGSGKTLAAAGFGLHHARARGTGRVIVAVPFISITEQNAGVYRKLLDREGEDSVVLEHHSGVTLDDLSGPRRWQRLAAENWDAPFVVTTTVQLFESLFDRRPAAMRKLHRLAGSVIILDEVQALPDRLLVPILSALRTLTECFGTSVLLATATQPSYWSLAPFRDLALRDIVADPKPLYERLRRVRYEWRLDPQPEWADIATEVAAEPQVLAVVNTTGDSAHLHALVEDSRDPDLGPCLHLSTRMTAQHRRDVLTEISRRLEAGEPVAAVATTLVEAGVDLDAPVVFRAFSSADSLQQAAGRANRSGRLEAGRVVVFDPREGGHPTDTSYKAAVMATRAHFGPDRADPDDPETLDRYYPHRYTLQNLDGAGVGVEIQQAREAGDFPEVAGLFEMIPEHTVPVAAYYGHDSDPECAELDRILGRLGSGAPGSAGDLRRLQPYLAAIPHRAARQAELDGLAEPVVGDLWKWVGHYDQRRGIRPSDLSATYAPEEFVW